MPAPLGRQRVAGPMLFLRGGADTATPASVNPGFAAGLRRGPRLDGRPLRPR